MAYSTRINCLIGMSVRRANHGVENIHVVSRHAMVLQAQFVNQSVHSGDSTPHCQWCPPSPSLPLPPHPSPSLPTLPSRPQAANFLVQSGSAVNTYRGADWLATMCVSTAAHLVVVGGTRTQPANHTATETHSRPRALGHQTTTTTAAACNY